MAEFIDTGGGTRLQIPEAVIAASNNRDLVAEYARASAQDRARIEQMARELTTPKPETSAPTAPAPEDHEG